MNLSERSSDILGKARDRADIGQGGPSQEDLDWAVATLQGEADTLTKEGLIRALGYATYRREPYTQVVEAFLTGPDVKLACSAMRVLCRYWELTDQYITQLCEFIKGVSWDVNGNCAENAMFHAQDFMMLTGQVRRIEEAYPRYEPCLMKALIETCENTDEDKWPADAGPMACSTLYNLLGCHDLSLEEMLTRAKVTLK